MERKNKERGSHQLKILRFLYRKGKSGILQAEIARKLQVSNSHVGNIIKTMVRRGWVEVESVSSGNICRNIVFLTKAGLAEAAERELFGTWHRHFAPTQLSIMDRLRTTKNMTVTELTTLLATTSNSLLTSAIALKKRGWVNMDKIYSVTYPGHGFVFQLSLTDEGRKAAEYYGTPQRVMD